MSQICESLKCDVFVCVSWFEGKVIESVRHHIKNPNNGARRLWWLLSDWQSGSLVRFPRGAACHSLLGPEILCSLLQSSPLPCSNAPAGHLPLYFSFSPSVSPFSLSLFLFLSSYIPSIHLIYPFDFTKLTPSFSLSSPFLCLHSPFFNLFIHFFINIYWYLLNVR